MTDISLIVRALLEQFQAIDIKRTTGVYEIADNLYDAMYQQYDYCVSKKDAKQQYRICSLIDTDILPKLDETIYRSSNVSLMEKLVALRKLFFALSARRVLKNFAFYIEQYKEKKVWDKTADTVEAVFHYADIFSISPVLNTLRASLMPSMGKSYIANLFVAQTVGNDPNAQILRITYSDDLCISTTRQTTDIIASKAFREIFPRYLKPEFEGDKIFKSKTSYQFCIRDCEDEYNLNAVTRDGQSTGKRAIILIIDDLLKDESESYNKELHKRMVDRFESTWTSRADSENLKIMLLGTMWADTDLLNVIYDRAWQEEEILRDPNHKFTEISASGKSVFIGVPALDENDESTCPKRYSTEFLQKKRKNMDRFLWMCVYQQDPIAPENLSFDYGALETYENLPETRVLSRYATLDPARKGKNFVSMPIFYKFDGYEKQHHLVDFLYQKKSMKELYDEIVDRIIYHRLNRLVLENNTDTSLKMVLDTKLKERGYFGCQIDEVYSTQNKEQRIKDHQGDIRGSIIYPAKGKYLPNTEFGKAMESVTSYSFDYPNKFDDAIDSIGMFSMYFLDTGQSFAKAGTFNRRMLGI